MRGELQVTHHPMRFNYVHDFLKDSGIQTLMNALNPNNHGQHGGFLNPCTSLARYLHSSDMTRRRSI